MPAADVRDERAGPHRPGGGQAGDQAGERVVGHGEQQQAGARGHLVGGQQRDAGQQPLGARHGGVRHAGGGHDAVPRPGEGRAEDGADPAGADDADGEPRRVGGGQGRARREVHGPFQSSEGYRSVLTWTITPQRRPSLPCGRCHGPQDGPVQPWSAAWEQALYGPGGFFVRSVPGEHFRTSVTASGRYAEAVRVLAGRVDDALGRPDPFDLVDLGAGRGELLHGLPDVPARWRLTAVERAPDPGTGAALGCGRCPSSRGCSWPTSGSTRCRWTWSRTAGWCWWTAPAPSSPARPRRPSCSRWCARWWPAGRAEVGPDPRPGLGRPRSAGSGAASRWPSTTGTWPGSAGRP